MSGVEIAGWFASPIIALLVSKIVERYQYQKDVSDKLKNLEVSLNKIQAVIHVAEQRQIDNPPLVGWLRDIKYDAYDAEDLLDRFDYRMLEDREKNKRKAQGEFRKFFKNIGVSGKNYLFVDADLKDLQKILDSFSVHANEIGRFLKFLSLDDYKKPIEMVEWRVTTSALTESRVFGRDEEKNNIKKFLLEAGNSYRSGVRSDVPILPIIGTGGVGKTTLAQWVYNDPIVRQHFNVRAWVCVSLRFEPKRIMTEIIESASIERPRDFHSIQNLDTIREILQRGLDGRRYLIVLDDVWDTTHGMSNNWDILRTVFNCGGEGSRVIVTSRDKKIADMMGTLPPIALTGLTEKEYWNLFVQCAFGGEDPRTLPALESIGRQLVKRLGGLPLAAKVVGGVLKSSLEESHWRGILDSKLWHVKQVQDNIWPVLRLSYEHLTSHLKQCFVFCSLFPKDYLFEKDRLVQIWIAEGFVQPSQERKPEDIGRAYFDELSRRSFFEKKQYQDEYSIHDMLHDFAESVSNEEYFRIEDERQIEGSPMRLRHLFVGAINNVPTVLNNMYDVKFLRSLVVCGRFDFHGLLNIIDKLRGLRVLILNDIYIDSLPDSAGNLVHLRYLELQKIDITRLPGTLVKLYHLQGLDVRGCARLLNLGIGFHNLPNLRYLNQ